MGTRAWVSISEGGVWSAIDAVRRRRLQAGGVSVVLKCFSHVGERKDGKGAEQKDWVSKGNEAADFLANRGREGARGVREEPIRGSGIYGIFDGNGPVEGNVREWVRNTFWEGEWERWALQSSQGKYTPMPTDAVAMAGMIEPFGAGHGRGDGGLALKLRTRVLPVPENLVLRDAGAEEKGVWTWREGGVECPLCHDGVGSVEHALADCERVRGAREAGMRELDELLRGWGDIMEPQGGEERIIIERGENHGKMVVERKRWEDWETWGRAKGYVREGQVAEWVWGLEGCTIAPVWPALCHEWLGVGPKKAPLKVGVMMGKHRNR
jgi:hypothetical protein